MRMKKSPAIPEDGKANAYKNYKRLRFDFYVNTAGEFQTHEGVDGLGSGTVDVEKTLVGRKFELFA